MSLQDLCTQLGHSATWLDFCFLFCKSLVGVRRTSGSTLYMEFDMLTGVEGFQGSGARLYLLVVCFLSECLQQQSARVDWGLML